MGANEKLQEAFADESQANRKYLAFARKAEQDGLPNVAKLFRAAAEAETIHAHAHLRAMGGINDTAANLKEAIEGEGFEFKEMYPEFIEVAEQENHKRAEISFKNAMAVEEIHHGLYSEALQAVEGGGDLPEQKVYVCAICGNTVHGEALGKCAICGAPHAQFFEVE